MIDIIAIILCLFAGFFIGIFSYKKGYKNALSKTEDLINAITSEYEELSNMIGGDSNARRS